MGFLRCQCWLLETVVDLVGSSVTEGGVSSSAVVEALDVGDDIAPGAFFRRVDGAVDALVLQRGENDSAIALSQHTPVRPIDERMFKRLTSAR